MLPTPAAERNVVPVSIVQTLPPQSKPSGASTGAQQPQSVMPPTQSVATNLHTQSIAASQGGGGGVSVPTTQVGMKHPPHVMSQTAHYAANPNAQQQIHLQQRDAQVLLPQHLQQQQQGHSHLPPQALPPQQQQQQQPVLAQKPQQQLQPPPPPKQQPPHQMPLHQSSQMQQTQPSSLQTQSLPAQSQPIVPGQQPNKPGMAQGSNAQTVVLTQSSQSGQQSAATIVAGTQNVILPQSVQPQRTSPPQQASLKGQSSVTQSSVSSLSPSPSELSTPENENNAKNAAKEQDDNLDDATEMLKKSALNPNAKEFIYNPTPKSFTPVSVS